MMTDMNQGMGCGMNPRAQQYGNPMPPCRPMPSMPVRPSMPVQPGVSMQTRDQLMKQINEASFAMDDVLLFLDTHPNNMEALQYYRNVSAMRKNALAAYQSQFGPLLVDDVTGNSWTWVTEKWPWEGGC